MYIGIKFNADLNNSAGGDTATTTSPNVESSTQSTTSATTKNIDYGMGSSSSKYDPQTSTDNNEDLYGESWWQKHSKGIFTHPRFKELSEFKKKYTDLNPLQELSNNFGGFDDLNTLVSHFGPVYRHMMSKGEGAQKSWQALYPILTKFLNDEDLSFSEKQQIKEAMEDSDNNDSDDPKYKELNDKLSSLENKLSEKDKKELEKIRKSNIDSYQGLLTKMFEKDKFPQVFEKYAAKLLMADIPRYMPKDPTGKFTSPLDNYNEEAFNSAYEKTFLALMKDAESYFRDKFKVKLDNNDGPETPDTSNSGRTPGSKVKMEDRHAKAQRLAQFFKSGQ